MLINGIQLDKRFNFHGGEVHIQLPENIDDKNIVIETILNSSDKVMELLLVKEALDHYYPDTQKLLKIAYFPYARQDRRCCNGESFSGKSFVNLIDSMRFNKIVFADIHSENIASLLKTPYREIRLIDILASQAQPIISYPLVFVSPDKGAFKKVVTVSEYFDNPLVVADKNRDASTGRILNIDITIGHEYIEGSNLLIIDDICDGGATFINLAHELLKHNPRSISLYVTHGIFSRGIDVLFDCGISKIFTTNSFCQLTPIKDKLTIWKI